MKARIIQPPYSRDTSLSDEYFEYKLARLNECDESLDIIVLPEYSDVPCATSTLEETLYYHEKYINTLLDTCSATAARCRSLLFVNALSHEETGLRNTTYVYDREGKLIGKYFKKHLPPLELETLALDSDYTFEYSEPFIMEIEGLKYAFLTCYDFYFYEAFANIARHDVDIIIGCSLQRSDTHDAIETMCRFLAYNTNAYVLRSSVSFGEDSCVCGASMAVDPFGHVLCNLRGRFGAETVEFDPAHKHLKPAGYGNPDASHHSYIEYGRKPWQYRPGGSAIITHDRWMRYPRICAHRGFSAVAPENSLPAFGAAVALGAPEIEFDLWLTTDGEWVSTHDRDLSRVSDGEGLVTDHTLAELKTYDFGAKFSPEFAGLRIPTFEEILKKFSCHTVMNIHIKTETECGGRDDDIYTDEQLKKMLALIDKYDCRTHVYFMTVSNTLHRSLQRLAPDIPRCMGEKRDGSDIVDHAIATGCKKVQFFKPYFNQEMIDRAHRAGIICNVFWSDDPEEAKGFLDMGIDTVLTNRYGVVSQLLK